MHFLCLHGAGSNSKIFELQTAAFRHELGGGHTYEFVEGTVPHQKAPGVEMLASPDEGFFAYYKPHCATSFNQALNDLQRYMETEGHFDGLVAFSQGTSLAMALLVGSPECLSHIRCAIFFSGRRPFVDCGTIPSVTSQVNAQEKMIRIPTAHIWGREDRVEPGESLALSELCPPQHRMIYVHAGGHEVPGPKDREGLVESVNIVRKLLVLANVEMPSQGRAWE